MNPRSGSSSKLKTHNQKLSTAFSETRDFGRRKKQQSRDPFRDLSNNKDDDTTQVLRFSLSHPSTSTSTSTSPPSSTSKTPHAPTRTHILFKPQHSSKSAPNTKLNYISKRNKPIIQKPKTNNPTSSLRHGQSGKRLPSSPFVPLCSHSSLPVSSSSLPNDCKVRSKNVNKRVAVPGACHSRQPSFTPVPASKVATGPSLNFALTHNAADDKSDAGTNPDFGITDTKTPPIQASVSPEIQCGSSTMSTCTKTPAPPCYGAGHVLSGVIDRRKCRPRGILTVGEPRPLSSFDSDNDAEQDYIEPTFSALPFAVEASVRWLLSPCNEEDENQKNCETECFHSRKTEDCTLLNAPPASPLSRQNDPIDFSDGNISTSISTASIRRSVSPLSPADLGSFRSFLGSPLTDDVVVSSPTLENSKHSPCSTASPVAVNVIQTPQTHSSSDARATMSWLGADTNNANKTVFACETDNGAEHLQTDNFSVIGHVPTGDSTSSSFQFDCGTTPSQAVHLSQFQGIFYDQASSFSNSTFSNSTLENASESQMRISWSEGLVSQIFEMDEFDCCRCLSDEEDVADGSNDNRLNSHGRNELNADLKVPDNGFGSIETIVKEYGIDEKANVDCPRSPKGLCSCAESISTDGGGLACSDDSDWTLCYKNQFFQE